MKKKLMLLVVMVLLLSLSLPMSSVFATTGEIEVPLYIKIGPAPSGMTGSEGWLQRVGLVKAEPVGDNLVVTYVPDSGWLIKETHLWVGEAPPFDYPQTGKGNPKIGHFPYSGEHHPPVADPDVVQYTIPLSEFPNYPMCTVAILAQAVVRPCAGGPAETAWGDCQPLPGPPPRWAKCFYYYFTPDS